MTDLLTTEIPWSVIIIFLVVVLILSSKAVKKFNKFLDDLGGKDDN